MDVELAVRRILSMFSGAEMTRGDLPQEDREEVVETLKVFSQLVAEICGERGLGPGRTPFVRPANFLTVLDTQNVHLVVDNVPIGGVTDHTYVDRRQNPPVTLEQVVGSAMQELGFSNPVAIDIPTTVVGEAQEVMHHQLQHIAQGVCSQLAQQATIESLHLPPGFQHYSRFMPAFLEDHPDIDRNVFLMMRFKRGPQYNQIDETLRRELGEYGLNLIRADDKDYTGDLWENVCLYMLGSSYGVVVFEEIDEREFNPSVALELGFMQALSKRCLILKDQRMPRMPADIVGKLYKEFDTYNIEASIASCVDAWTCDIGLRL